MRYELLVTDLDGTLLNDAGGVSKENKEALQKLIDNGGRVALASGRAEITMEPVIKMVGLTKQKHIGHNGSSIFDLNGYRKIDNYLSREDIIRALDLFKEHNIECCVLAKTGIYHMGSYNLMKALHKYEKGYPVYEQNPYEIPDVMEIYGIINNEEEREMMLSWSNEHVNIFEGNGFIYFMPKCEGKYPAAKRLAKEFGIREEKILCVGDGGNDLDMLRDSPLGIAVANAIDDAKDAADVVYHKTNEENAIKHIVEEYFLGEGNGN